MDGKGAGFLETIRALTFDVFGTVVDWRGSILTEGQRLGAARGIHIDWAQFADAWRSGYRPSMDAVRRGDSPWVNLDVLHRRLLDDLLVRFGVQGLSEDDRVELNRVWHRLQPWPDAVEGLQRLKRRYTIATLSNGHVALLTNMAKSAGLPWDCVLSAELARHYKPDVEVYQTAANLLDLEPRQVMMVAAHESDLQAARRVGFRTAFVYRPLEFGPTGQPDLPGVSQADVNADDFLHLASQLGA
ncbi:MAG: haloacid dehalogenase type II [Anaerolineae bacterium]|nr:haloacid dehalogenase type II [Anaerolineae bacterium]